PRGPRREPLRRHEVARRLRDALRHHPPGRAPGNRVDHARPRRRPLEGRADAALRRAHLQRLLVRARARDAAGADRQEPGACRGAGAPQALQGQRHRHGARERQLALFHEPRHLRGRQGRLRPEGCRRLHPPQRAAAENAGGAEQGWELRSPMFSRLELGRIAGITVYLDMMFVLVLLLFCYPYFTSGSTQLMSAGFVIVVGLILSILLHELGHAFAGRLFDAHVSHIDLTGLGGVAHFERSLPTSALKRSVIYLAGPAVNLALWKGLGWLAVEAAFTGNPMVGLPLAVLATANLYLMIF